MKIIKDKETKYETLSPKVYKWLKILSVVELLLILICPWFKLFDFSTIVLGFYLLDVMDIVATFFQRKNMNSFIAIILGLIISVIICIILFFYAMWASGRVQFVK